MKLIPSLEFYTQPNSFKSEGSIKMFSDIQGLKDSHFALMDFSTKLHPSRLCSGRDFFLKKK
jgi:hypothetical protein